MGNPWIIHSRIAKMRDHGISDEVICAVHRPSGLLAKLAQSLKTYVLQKAEEIEKC
jgi:hypothetical protein